MSSDHRQSNASGHCDDVLENPSDAPLADPRQGGYFIDDDSTLLEWSEESADEDEIDDDNRVEDEDWEIAEGGLLIMNKYF